MNNIILTGMSGAGKSTLGVLLAKSINKEFIDTDLLIQKRYGKLLHEIIDERGIDGFKKCEEQVLLELDLNNCIIATGGSVIYTDKGMKHLRSLGKVVFINVDYVNISERLNNIKTRGVVMEKGQTLKELYDERLPLYKKYSDLIMDVSGENIEETVSRLVELL